MNIFQFFNKIRQKIKVFTVRYFLRHGPFKMCFGLKAQYQKAFFNGSENVTHVEELSAAPYLKTRAQLVDNQQ